MTDVDRQIARAGDLLDRTRAERQALATRRRQGVSVARRLALAGTADLAIIVAAITIMRSAPTINPARLASPVP